MFCGNKIEYRTKIKIVLHENTFFETWKKWEGRTNTGPIPIVQYNTIVFLGSEYI